MPLKYVSSFFRSLKLPLINCKIHLELSWSKNCVMYASDAYATIVILTTKDNINFTKQLNKGFKRSVYWNEYKTKIETKQADNNDLTRFYLDASYQGVTKLYVLSLDDTILANGNDGLNRVERNSHRKYFLPRVNITNFNV